MSTSRVGSPLAQPTLAPVAPVAAPPAQQNVAAPKASVQADSVQFATPTPLPDGQPEKAYDGAILGGDGKAYPRGSIDSIPPFRPQNGKTPTDTIVFVNGIGSSKSNNQGYCQTLANASGANVIGVDNASEGSLRDLVQSAGDIMHQGGDQCVNSLSKIIYDKMMAGQPLHVMGYSQGAIISSRAISDAQNRMMLEGGLSQAQVQQRMHSLLSLETVGGAAPKYPDGPKYVHYLNSWDGVERLVGLESALPKHAGDGAKTVEFSSGINWNPFAGHAFNHYMDHYKPFNQVYGG